MFSTFTNLARLPEPTKLRENSEPFRQSTTAHSRKYHARLCAVVLFACAGILSSSALLAQSFRAADIQESFRVPGIDRIPTYRSLHGPGRREVTYGDRATLPQWWDARLRCRREEEKIEKGEYELRTEYETRRQRLLTELSCEQYWPLENAVLSRVFLEREVYRAQPAWSRHRYVDVSYDSDSGQFRFAAKLGTHEEESHDNDGVTLRHFVCLQVDPNWKRTVTAADLTVFDGQPSVSGGEFDDGVNRDSSPMYRCTQGGSDRHTADLVMRIDAGIHNARALRSRFEDDLQLELHGRAERFQTEGYPRRGFQFHYVYVFWVNKVNLVDWRSGAVLFSAGAEE